MVTAAQPEDGATGTDGRRFVCFVSHELGNGRDFHAPNVIDEFSRECVQQVVDPSISEQRLTREFRDLGNRLPRTTVCDNGPELMNKTMSLWTWEVGDGAELHQVGELANNAFVGSFNYMSRNYCLDPH